MKHLDLFSGIGGFSLAAENVWQEDYECIGFCDINPFAQNSLRKNFSGVKIYGDIRTLTNTNHERLLGRSGSGIQNSERILPDKQTGGKTRSAITRHNIDLLTGGFPCQPFSVAGKRKGTDDDRYLWPEMLRIIREFKPRWIIGENVAGIVNMALEQVCLDLEAEGYEVQPFIIPACAVNAPHRRDRVWIVGYDTNNGQHGSQDGESGDEGGNSDTSRPDEFCQFKGTDCLREIAPHSNTGLEGRRIARPRHSGLSHKEKCDQRRSWDENWFEIATSVCRVDDGLPKRMARLPDGTSISEAKWRQEALKAYGNSIVPLVAEKIMQKIKIIDDFYKILK